MQYVLIEREHDLDDEPYQVFSELDDNRKILIFRMLCGRKSEKGIL